MIQSLQNPFRDWNSRLRNLASTESKIQSLQNPFRDWNTTVNAYRPDRRRFKASKTLLGIETRIAAEVIAAKNGFKASKTLLGIETLTTMKTGF